MCTLRCVVLCAMRMHCVLIYILSAISVLLVVIVISGVAVDVGVRCWRIHTAAT